MKYTKEIGSLNEFPAWAGAGDTLARVRKAGKMDQLDALAEDEFSLREELPTEGDINDWLWFASDEIFEMLGIEE